MIEILDPKILDEYIYGRNLLDEIKKFSFLKDNRIGWNYCFDYVWLALEIDKFIRNRKKDLEKIIDIGAGPGAIHGFLENKYNINIIGIDLHRWGDDYVDLVGDYNNSKFREDNGFVKNGIDLIISTSAFEHNKPSKHAILVKNCLSTLNDDGRLITTFAVTNHHKISHFKKSAQWNLTFKHIKEIYGEDIQNKDEYEQIHSRWNQHKIIQKEYFNRYGEFKKTSPSFLSIGANIKKENLLNQKIRMTYLGA